MLLLAVLTYRNSWGHLFHTDNLLVLHVLVVGLAPAADAWSLDAPATPPTDRPTSATAGPCGWRRWSPCSPTSSPASPSSATPAADWVAGDTLLHQITFDNARKKVLGEHLLAPSPAHWPPIPGCSGPIGAAHDPRRARRADGAARPPVGDRLGRPPRGLLHVGIVALMAIAFPYPLSLVAFAPFFDCERPFRAILRWVGGRRQRLVPLDAS